MSLFEMYLRLGFKHIIDLNGYDHIIFLLALCSGYSFTQFRKIVFLVTAFTIGHSITLAVATLQIFSLDSSLVKFLIALTILITAITNLFDSSKGKSNFIYFLTLFFGLIHGLGFSNYLKQLLGNESSIFVPLLAFNVGLELGQLLIVGSHFLVLFLGMTLFKINHKNWKLFLSGIAVGISTLLILENKIW